MSKKPATKNKTQNIGVISLNKYAHGKEKMS